MPDEKEGRLDEEYVVQMKGITKVYPNGVAANQGVDFFLRKGETLRGLFSTDFSSEIKQLTSDKP